MSDEPLRARLHAFAVSGDAALVRGDEALAEEAALRGTVGDLQRDHRAIQAVGLVRWARCVTAGDHCLRDDLAEAARCLGYLVRITPSSTPPLAGRALAARALDDRIAGLEAMLTGERTAAIREVREFCAGPMGALDDPLLARGVDQMIRAARLCPPLAGFPELADVDAAIGLLRSAIAALVNHPRHRSEATCQLGGSLYERFRVTGDERALREARALLGQAVDSLPPRHPDRLLGLVLLGAALRSGAELTRDAAMARESVACGRTAVRDLDEEEDREALIAALVVLSLSLRFAFELAPNHLLIDEGLEVTATALRLALPSHGARWSVLLSRAWFLLLDCERGGPTDSCRLALEAAEAAAVAAPVDSARRSALVDVNRIHLRLALREGDISRIEDLLSPGAAPGPQAPSRLSAHDVEKAMSVAVMNGDYESLDELLAQLDQELATITDSRDRAAVEYARGLGRFVKVAREPDLQTARDCADALAEALRMAVPGQMDRRLAHFARAFALYWVFQATNDVTVGRGAVHDIEAAIAAAGPDGPWQAGCQELARMIDDGLRAAAGEEPSAAAGDLGGLVFELLPELHLTAGRTATAPRLLAADQLGVAGLSALLSGDNASACRHFERLIRILADVVGGRMRDEDRRHVLSSFADVPMLASSAALGLGDPGRALELLESGRGALLAAALETHHPSDELRWRAPDLVDRFERAQREGDEASAGPPLTPARHRQVARRWEGLLEEIRDQPGLGDFLRPPDELRLRALARAGSLVTFCLTEARADALIVSGDEVRALALPGVDHPTIVARAGRWNEVVRRCHATRKEARRAALRVELGRELQWLWDYVAGPVLDALGHPAGSSSPPRVWWSPYGPLARLPIHAAGHHDGSGRSVLERVVPTTTPGLHLLAHSRVRTNSETLAGGPLVVAVSEAVDGQPLPGANQEADWIRELFAEAPVLRDREASREAVLRVLPGHPWVHFACHALVAPDSPSDSGLVLTDGLLRVRDLARLRPVDAELAFLSACRTAGGTGPAWGPATLAEAVQAAGYRHVIATLWEINDLEAASLARAVCTRLRPALGTADRETRDGTVAAALRAAVLAADAYPGAPDLWAAYVHAGP